MCTHRSKWKQQPWQEPFSQDCSWMCMCKVYNNNMQYVLIHTDTIHAKIHRYDIAHNAPLLLQHSTSKTNAFAVQQWQQEQLASSYSHTHASIPVLAQQDASLSVGNVMFVQHHGMCAWTQDAKQWFVPHFVQRHHVWQVLCSRDVTYFVTRTFLLQLVTTCVGKAPSQMLVFPMHAFTNTIFI